MESRKLSSYWWFDSHNITRNSPWLQSTLAELDGKTESMLNLIDQDADSFAKRAEMYYNKRPELIKLIEDSYRIHRALALDYNLATKTGEDKSYDSYSDSIDLCRDRDSNESETDGRETIDDECRSESNGEEVLNLRGEIDRLREEIKIQKMKLVEKDEEKREAIRELSFCVDLIKQENLDLKKRGVSKMRIDSRSIFSRGFWEKMFSK